MNNVGKMNAEEDEVVKEPIGLQTLPLSLSGRVKKTLIAWLNTHKKQITKDR